MSSTWDQILRMVIAGTDRSPLPADVVHQLGLKITSDATLTALEALPVARLLQKAAHILPAAAELTPDIAPDDERPLCPSGATPFLRTILEQDIYSETAGEFFHLLNHLDHRLPPELLPRVLDFYSRRRYLPEPVRQVIEPAGSWLARFNPSWSELFNTIQADWETGTLAERLQLLGAARAQSPLVGLAWLEKTWKQERAEHKARFLDLLRTGLSALDEPLLERALTDRSRQVRFLACRLLLLLPDSTLRTTLQDILTVERSTLTKQKNLFSALKKIIPEDGPFSGMWLLALTSERETAPVAVWSRLIPAEDLGKALGLPASDCMERFFAPDQHESLPATGLLEQIAWHCDPEWATATADWFSRRPAHPLWESPAMAALLACIPQQQQADCLNRLAQSDNMLETPTSALVRHLLTHAHTWPRASTMQVLQYPLRTQKPRHWLPPAHFRELLQRLAYCCRAEDLAGMHVQDEAWPYAWQVELNQVFSIVRFRQQMHKSLAQ
ncbi:MAG: hypothetical protein EP344_02650 [Bacteroidetes bacterium]|nr:MAG: hypothetical protein EP344_02650 [Bacteroidota bacterium]